MATMTQEASAPRIRTALSLFTLVHALFLMIGSGAGLLLRVYFIHGGKRIWLSTLLQIAGWPLLLVPLSITSRKLQLSVWMYVAFSILGVLFAVDCYLYALAWEYLPLSTSSLLVSSQLGFTAVLAFLIVRQRFTPFSFNAVVLLTMGPVVMSMGADSDRPEGESNGKYVLGFAMAVAAAALCGLVFVLMELVMRKGKVVRTYASAMEMQLVMGIAGTVFALAGMAVNKDFQFYCTSLCNPLRSIMVTTTQEASAPRIRTALSLFTLVHALFLMIGSGAGLLLRVYFIHGGKRIWLSTLLQIAGWPLLLIPLSITSRKLQLSVSMYVAFSILGVLFAFDCYLYALASAYLPLSTSSLLVSSQLGFTAVFAFLIVRQRFTPFSFNAVVLLTMGPVVMSMGADSDRPEGESKGKYVLGFVMAVVAAALCGLIFVLMELAMRKGKVVRTYASAMEMQLVMGIAGTVFALAGMAVNKDFQAIQREAREFGLGKMKYYMVLVWDAVFWQLVNIGLVGLISGASSLFLSVMLALQLPLVEMLAVIFLREKFSGIKGISLVLALWGFVSYLYGEKKQSDKAKKAAAQQELAAVASLETM